MFRKISLLCIPLGLLLLVLLSACGAPMNGSSSTTGANSTTTVPTSTATGQPTTVPTTAPGVTQQYAFTAQDSGKTITYGITTRFSLSLDQQKYPRQNLQLSCQSQNALGSVSNAPYAAPPLYAVSYETIAVGDCAIKDGNFILTVIIIDTTTPTATSTPSPATPTAQPQTWKLYQAMTFTLRYPAGWSVNVIPSGLAGSYYKEEIDFRPTPTSLVGFMVNALYNGEMSPDTLLHNDPFYKDCTINSQSKVTINGILWSTASGMTKGPQVAPAQMTLAYANDKRPYRVEFAAPPDQFAAYAQTFNTMFQSFRES